MLEYPHIFAMSGYSDTVDMKEDSNNLGEDGSANVSPFARLEAGVPQTRGVQVKEWSQRLNDGFSLAVHHWKFRSRSIGESSFAENYPKAGCHPTKIPQMRSNRVGQFPQVRSGQYSKVPS